MNTPATKSLGKTRGAVIYTRVSTGDQDKHGTSPETQLDACRAKALALSLPIVAEYYDGGVSGGFLLARKEFQAAIADIREGRADTLICPNISRYSRDVEHQQSVKKAIRATGGRLVFCDMDFDETPEGDLNFTIQGGFAEYEKAVIRKRTVAGRERKAHQGVQTARVHSPFGYHVVGTADVIRGDYPGSLLGQYVVIEAEAQIVRELFARYAAGASHSGLAQWLNGLGVPTRQGKPFWGHTTLAYILRNPVYKGLAAFGKSDYRQDETRQQQRHPYTGGYLKTKRACTPADPATWITWPVPALVSEDEWIAAQSRSTSRGGKPPLRVRLLAGRIFCPECEAGVVCASSGVKRGDGSTHYACGHYLRLKREAGESRCVSRHYPIPFVESAVVEAVTEALRRPDLIAEAWETARQAFAEKMMGEAPTDGGGAAELARVEQSLADLDRKQAATVKAQIAGMEAGAEASAYNAVFAEIADQRKALTARREALTSKAATGPRSVSAKGVTLTPEDYPNLLADVQRVLTSPDLPGEDKRDALGLLVERVYPIPDGARVVFRADAFTALSPAFLSPAIPASFPTAPDQASN